MEKIRLGLVGHAGRMGQALLAHLDATTDIEVACRLEAGESVGDFIEHMPEVVVDLSSGAAVAAHGPAIIQAGLAYIIGATGLTAETVQRLASAALASDGPVLLVPNFSIGANLMIRFAATAAVLMEAPVITERHHAGKADAPSGTAEFTAQRINAALDKAGRNLPELSVKDRFAESLPGVRGGAAGAATIHSVRGSGYLAEQAVEFCLPGETLLIEHRSIDRRCFMPGIEYAIRNIHRVQGMQIGLDSILDV